MHAPLPFVVSLIFSITLHCALPAQDKAASKAAPAKKEEAASVIVRKPPNLSFFGSRETRTESRWPFKPPSRNTPLKKGNESRRVDLIGAVHVAHKEYFQDLNRRFRSYDALLYELVADPDAGCRKQSRMETFAIRSERFKPA